MEELAGDTEQQAALHGFYLLFAEDLAAGTARRLADYQARFPGHEAEIAAEFADLTAAGAAELRRVGPYQLLQELGRGGQATVWLARDTRLPRRVALKVLRRGPASREAELRLRREAEATARLDDSGICQVFEVGEDQGESWIAMRYVPGETLAARIAADRDRRAARSPSRGEIAAAIRAAAATFERAACTGPTPWASSTAT
jgi:serine/threonine protein kinase